MSHISTNATYDIHDGCCRPTASDAADAVADAAAVDDAVDAAAADDVHPRPRERIRHRRPAQ